MKRQMFLRRAAALVCALACTAVLLPARAAGAEPAVSSNDAKQTYSSWSGPVDSYLMEEGGVLTRVEYIGESIVVEDYDAGSFTLQGSRSIPMELPLFGGFFAGEEYNFFVFGQENPNEDDSREVVRVVKYSKQWQRLGQASLYGANTVTPFKAGSCRMAEGNGVLFVRTCHEMYQTSDGLNHQSSFTFTLDEDSMEFLTTQTGISNLATGYVSHSFNQFLLLDGDNLVAADHGDAYPRSIVLIRYMGDNAKNGVLGLCQGIDVLEIYGQTGNNVTGATLGGLAAGKDHYVVAGTSVAQDGSAANGGGGENLFVGSVDKDSGAVELHWLTDYAPISGSLSGATWWEASTPHLIPLEDGTFLLMWQLWFRGGKVAVVQYAVVEETGNVLRSGQLQGVCLSDCQGILVDGDVVWYTTEESGPTFYRFDPDDGTCTAEDRYGSALSAFSADQPVPTFTDVPADAWYRETVEQVCALGLMKGTGADTFSPDAKLTNAEAAVLAARVRSLCQQDGTTFVQGDPWYQSYWDYAFQHGCAGSVMGTNAQPQQLCTRAGFAGSLAAAVPESVLQPLPHLEGFSDSALIRSDYASARQGISLLYTSGVISGVPAGDGSLAFCPGNPITRAEAAAILARLILPELRQADLPTQADGAPAM
ncbi:S-layer homology domain-containing protein [Flavonifractor hominis]|uniref:S-layer homology domain-containing protein n=1 Tax=Flavonifractor hominis TaxID=3133178 RepID=A0ABV1EVA5_9FIRM